MEAFGIVNGWNYIENIIILLFWARNFRFKFDPAKEKKGKFIKS